ARRHDARLRHEHAQPRLRVSEPARQEHVRMRVIFYCMSTSTDTIEQLATREYKYGFETTVDAETIPVGLSEDVVRLISSKKDEPAWLLDFRLKSYRTWLTMTDPVWHNLKIAPIDYQ